MFPQLIGSLEELAWQEQEVSHKDPKKLVCRPQRQGCWFTPEGSVGGVRDEWKQGEGENWWSGSKLGANQYRMGRQT